MLASTVISKNARILYISHANLINGLTLFGLVSGPLCEL